MTDILEAALGAILVAWMLIDVFQSVVVPRPTPGARASSLLVRVLWPRWRGLALDRDTAEARERLLGTFASTAVVLILATWLAGLIVGFGLLFHALRAGLRPVPDDVFGAIYFAGTSLLTIGFGDVVATSAETRLLAIVAAACGLGVLALAISFVFSLFGNFQRREALVVTLDERAGAPPSGVRLLETFALEDMRGDLPRFFGEWERWMAEVLDTHISYPILTYFRSTHDNESWVSAVGAVLDAATLVLTTIEDVPRGQAKMLWNAGNHLVEDIGRTIGTSSVRQTGVERDEFDDARSRLAAAGYRLGAADGSWERFAQTRAAYASVLNDLAREWAVPPALWIGDRSYLPHRPA